jgi:uncharacterized membrane protein
MATASRAGGIRTIIAIAFCACWAKAAGAPNSKSANMVEIVKSISAVVATCSEFIAVVVIVVGAFRALGSMVKTLIERKTAVSLLVVFGGFAGWLVLALEFLLAADMLRTAISPTWTDIGQLAANRRYKNLFELLAEPRLAESSRDEGNVIVLVLRLSHTQLLIGRQTAGPEES